ncbi:sensor histidine kinase [Algoriphagus formosus]|uniref:sensor histidine kinase n=1 Tax=Algoriphagus formosus TaxID=2007308 RepID=UPI000C28E08C|nr:ATP-binding protein [Algoriphagus formosus]
MNLNSLRILFSLIIGLLIILCIWTYWNLNNYISSVDKVREANHTLQLTTQILSLIKDAETGHRGYQLSNDEQYLEPYYEAKKELPLKLDQLDSLSVGHADLLTKVDEFRKAIDSQLAIIEQILQEVQEKGSRLSSEELTLLSQGKANMDLVRSIAEDINILSRNEAQEEEQEEGAFKKVTPINLLVVALIAFGGVLLLFTRAVLLLEQRDKKSKNLTEALEDLKKATEQTKQVSDLLRNVLDSSRDGIMAYRSIRNTAGEIEDFQLVLANRAAFLITNRSESEILGQRLLDLFPGNKGFLYEEYSKVVESGEDFKTEIEYLLDGKYVWFKILATKFEDGFVVTFSDITEDKATGIKLANYTQELKRSNEDLEQFAYVASHDLQEPLRKIRSFGDRLITKYRDQLDETGQNYIDRMQVAAKRMQNLIEDLLAFSRITRSSELPGMVNMKEVFEEIQEDLFDQIARTKAKLEIEGLPDVLGVKSQVQRLFQNLVSNGLKFSKKDLPPLIRVSGKIISAVEASKDFKTSPRYDNYVQITVSDNGIGFNERYKDQIFNVFQRLHGKNEFEGTGIGLAICKKIILHHGGAIRVESEEGIGSDFIVIFPLNKQAGNPEHHE